MDSLDNASTSVASGDTWNVRGDSFGLAATTYEQSRPSYPSDAVRWLLGDRGLTVVELGAGTGLLTRALIAAGHTVTAVEPDDSMRAQMTETTPQAEILAGGAESIPVDDASADAVVVGHAYHWFDPEPAHAEIARVIRPGGTFGTFWNLRDEDVPWSAELTKILADEDTGTGAEGSSAIMLHGALDVLRGRREGAEWLMSPTFGDRFTAIERNFFPNEVEHTPKSLLELIRSRSYYLTSDNAKKEEIDRQVRELTSSHPELRGRETFKLRYVTVAFRSQARERP
jgi:SAM-dependent methyltransferase